MLAFRMLESSLGLIFGADEWRAVTRIRGFFAALFCGFCVHMVWGGGMYARYWRAYVVATEV